MSLCRSCKQPLLWARTERGNPIPLDARPVDNGTFVISRNADGVYIAQTWRAGSAQPSTEPATNSPEDLGVVSTAPASTGPRYASHFATCGAAAHRRAR